MKKWQTEKNCESSLRQLSNNNAMPLMHWLLLPTLYSFLCNSLAETTIKLVTKLHKSNLSKSMCLPHTIYRVKTIHTNNNQHAKGSITVRAVCISIIYIHNIWLHMFRMNWVRTVVTYTAANEWNSTFAYRLSCFVTLKRLFEALGALPIISCT